MSHLKPADTQSDASSYTTREAYARKWLLALLTLLYATPLVFIVGCHQAQNTPTPSTSSPTPTVQATPPPNTATLGALKALRKLNSATEAGVSYVRYESLAIDAKAEVDEALTGLSNEELKKELKLAAEAYTDALLVWREMLERDGNYIYYDSEVGEILVKKYRLPVPSDQTYIISSDYSRSAALTQVWGAGSKHIERASALLR